MEATKKLYYETAYQRDFAAQVLSVEAVDGRWRVALTETCFYPEGGGQPPDYGLLDDCPVTDCQLADGLVWHILENKPSFDIGDQVAGAVDFPRRMAFMQNHSGEHLLSGLAKSRYGAANVGFHMSVRGFTIDFDLPLDKQQLDEMEALANEIVTLGGPILLSFVDGKALHGLDARAKRDFPPSAAVRLVDIPGHDLCACAGLHVADLAEVGLVKITARQRYKGGVRLNVYCGVDALWDYTRKNDILQELSVALSAETESIVAALTGLKEARLGLKKASDALKHRVFELHTAAVPPGTPLAFRYEDGLDGDDLRRFANMLGTRAQIALAISGEGTAYKYAAYAADSAALADFAADLNAALNGRGGISGTSAQGALKADMAAIETYMRDK